MEELIQAIEGNEWNAVAAFIILAFTALARDISSRVGLTGLPSSIVSALSSYLSGVAVILPVAPQWWHALLIAIGTPVASQGLRDLIVDIIKGLIKKRNGKSYG